MFFYTQGQYVCIKCCIFATKSVSHGKNKKLVIIIAALIVVVAGVSFLAFNEFRKIEK